MTLQKNTLKGLREKGFLVLNASSTMSSLQSTVLSVLPEGYAFLKYEYTILGPALYTYHRDVTSSKSSLRTLHPTYTAIRYEYEGDFLSVSPGSHHEWKYNLPITLKGKNGTVILFDCDLVHAGLDAPPNTCRKAVQYKIAHKDDLHLLFDLQGVQVTHQAHDNHWLLKRVLLVLSYVLTVPIQVLGRPLLQRQLTGILGRIQSIFPIRFYNNVK